MRYVDYRGTDGGKLKFVSFEIVEKWELLNYRRRLVSEGEIDRYVREKRDRGEKLLGLTPDNKPYAVILEDSVIDIMKRVDNVEVIEEEIGDNVRLKARMLGLEVEDMEDNGVAYTIIDKSLYIKARTNTPLLMPYSVFTDRELETVRLHNIKIMHDGVSTLEGLRVRGEIELDIDTSEVIVMDNFFYAVEIAKTLHLNRLDYSNLVRGLDFIAESTTSDIEMEGATFPKLVYADNFINKTHIKGTLNMRGIEIGKGSDKGVKVRGLISNNQIEGSLEISDIRLYVPIRVEEDCGSIINNSDIHKDLKINNLHIPEKSKLHCIIDKVNVFKNLEMNRLSIGEEVDIDILIKNTTIRGRLEMNNLDLSIGHPMGLIKVTADRISLVGITITSDNLLLSEVEAKVIEIRDIKIIKKDINLGLVKRVKAVELIIDESVPSEVLDRIQREKTMILKGREREKTTILKD